jgi:hypothetical protein
VLVTVRDRHGALVRDAIVSVAGVAGASATLGSSHVGYSNRLGRAAFRIAIGPTLAGKRLRLAVAARTPSAHTRRLAALRLPPLTTTTL